MDDAIHPLRLSVSDFIALTNQTLEYAYPLIEVEGEVAGFKVNQGKYVFFDIKDENSSISCFMMAWQLRIPIEDGMQVIVSAAPKLTQWGKFSLTVKAIRPSGEGSLKKSFELLKSKLEKEGLFALERKRTLPELPSHIAVISSTDAAGYADFIKILNDRWGGVMVDVAHVQVQGADAPDQIIKALNYFNSQEDLPEVIVIVRGGGSADDLATFNDELLVREIATSRIPTLVGVGHEVDVTLADLVADVRAATPSNAAQILVPDRREVVAAVRHKTASVIPQVMRLIDSHRQEVKGLVQQAFTMADYKVEQCETEVGNLKRVIGQLNPRLALKRGYAIVMGDVKPGKMIEIEKSDILIRAEVKDVRQK
ncbi:MAG TPA: exodeoxyribonuclease VII large subunit [Candidatus Saccharimonadales bacterium]|nr:exodeoxyribonuclease VII large subunit [Candidatus Saccharimonadales bacterium]